MKKTNFNVTKFKILVHSLDSEVCSNPLKLRWSLPWQYEREEETVSSSVCTPLVYIDSDY